MTPPIDLDAFREFEVSGWEKVGGAYHRFVGSITARVIDPLLDAARVAPKVRVLDVATGPGYVAARAGERGAAVVGVDISAPMVALASRNHPNPDPLPLRGRGNQRTSLSLVRERAGVRVPCELTNNPG